MYLVRDNITWHPANFSARQCCLLSARGKVEGGEGYPEQSAPLQKKHEFEFRPWKNKMMYFRAIDFSLFILISWYNLFREYTQNWIKNSCWLNCSHSESKQWMIQVTVDTRYKHDCHEDCPFYEQLQCAIDTTSSALFTYRLSSDDRLSRQAIVQPKNTFQPGIGLTARRGPAHGQQINPRFSPFWDLFLINYHEYFGDAQFSWLSPNHRCRAGVV